ncbi:MAG: flagellar motor protein MotB [Paracoccaceae bacterium]|nr:flagellar motor protein MotB [Paracoccaceae bacterium]
MARQGNAAPVIIKRKKIIQGGGHHGGAWKVAYADFVTAMMAFFLLMWLLGATSEKQRKGVADYFSPTIPLNRISGGGDGAFGGDSIFTKEELGQSGTGASSNLPTVSAAAENQAQSDQRELESLLKGFGGESMTMQQALRHVITKVTDEGLIIEIYDIDDTPLFLGSTAEPEPILRDIARMLAEVLQATKNGLALNGHVKSYPITLIDNPAWTLSAARAQAFRNLIAEFGLPPNRVQRVSGFADRKPVTADPTAIRNNRLEVILLRRDR